MPANSTAAPANWPSTLPYIGHNHLSPTLTPAHLSALRTRVEEDYVLEASNAASKQPNPLVKIQPITDKEHPACGQSGLYAAQNLEPGSFVIQYLGEIHGKKVGDAGDEAQGVGAAGSEDDDPHATSDYDLSLDRDAGLAIDAAKMGNEARFINDYRGVPLTPSSASSSPSSSSTNLATPSSAGPASGTNHPGQHRLRLRGGPKKIQAVMDSAKRARQRGSGDGDTGENQSNEETSNAPDQGFGKPVKRETHSRPNAEFREVWDATLRQRGIGVFILPEGKGGDGAGKKKKGSSGVRKGEEILISYGRGFWAARREGEDSGDV